MAWRSTLRSGCAYATVMVPLAMFLLFVAVSRFPDAAWVARLAQIPAAGVAIDLVRQRYLSPGDTALGQRHGDPASASQGRTQGDASRETLFVGIGAQLHRTPRPGSEVLRKTRRLGEYAVLSRRLPNWVELELPGSESGSAWLDLAAPRDLTPPLGSDPAPPQPVAARPVEARVLQAARREMGRNQHSFARYGYAIVSDVEDRTRLDAWLELLRGIEAKYAARYGVAPIGNPAETLAIFSTESEYRAFQDQVEGLEGLGRGVSTGHASGGLAALFVGQRSGPEVAATLVHEIAHLLTRRAIGPALPLWLDEGIAEDFAYFSGPAARPLAGYRSRSGNQIRIWGPLAGLQLLVGSDRQPPSLQLLFEFDRDLFVRSNHAASLYTQSAFLVHFLLEGEAAGSLLQPPPEGFRSFLQSLAAGDPPSPSNLTAQLNRAAQQQAALGEDVVWREPRLQQAFDAYLRSLQENTPGLEP